MRLHRAPSPLELVRKAPFWLLPMLVGAALRLYRVDEQLLVDDELHGIRAALGSTVGRILTTYESESDPCAPLAALFRSVYLSTGRLSDLVLRLPSLIAGILILALFPRWLACRGGGDVGAAPPPAARIAAWLIALAPGFVLYSRIVRPYSLVVLFGLLAAIAIDRTWSDRRVRPAALFAVSGTLAFWLFPGSAPFLAAILLSALIAKRLVPRDGPSWPALLGAGAGLAAGAALVVLPRLASFLDLVDAKRALGRPPLFELGPVLELQAGASDGPWAALFWLLALAGLARLARRDARLALLTGVPVAGQAVGLWILAPVGLGNPIVYNRYLLVALPLVLVWTAEGLAAFTEIIARRVPRLARAVPAVVVAGLFLAGPLADGANRWSSFLHDDGFLGYYVPRARVEPESAMPAFYLSAAAREGGGILELNGLPAWGPVGMLAAFQGAHRRPVWLAPTDPGLFLDGVDLGRLRKPTPESFLGSPARWLVLHRDAGAEHSRLRWPGALGVSGFKPALFEAGRGYTAAMAQKLERAWGRAAFDADGLAVWDLDAVRASVGPPVEKAQPEKRRKVKRRRHQELQGSGAAGAESASGAAQANAAVSVKAGEGAPSSLR